MNGHPFAACWRRGAAVATLLLAGACTPMQWEHPSLAAKDDPQVAIDERYCRALGEREAYAFGPEYRRYRGRDGRVYYERNLLAGPEFGSPFTRRVHVENDCMRAKGYRLVPAGP